MVILEEEIAAAGVMAAVKKIKTIAPYIESKIKGIRYQIYPTSLNIFSAYVNAMI